MALARDIMTGGFSAIGSRAVNGQVNPSVTAAGSTQGTATALTKTVNVITAGSGGGVILASVEIGDSWAICNISGGNVTIYPASGERINGLSTNTGFILANNTAATVQKFTATRNFAIMSA